MEAECTEELFDWFNALLSSSFSSFRSSHNYHFDDSAIIIRFEGVIRPEVTLCG